MIVCRECGTQNEDDDLFCGGCPAFLEHSGELIDDGTAVAEAAPSEASEREGFVTRIRHAISGDHLPPPTGDPSSGGASLAPPSGHDRADSAPPDAHLDDEQRRAKALLAKPTEHDRAEPAASAPAEQRSTGARPPEAVVPQATQVRGRKVQQPPSRKILPGDLICGACGEGNPDSRKFCRRCGETLVEAEVQRPPWWRRIIPSRSKKTKSLKASERPDRGRSGTVGSKARVARGKFLGKFAQARRVLALLAIVGIGVGFAIPSVRSAVTDGASDGFGRIRRVVSPTYSNIPIDPDLVVASSARPNTEAADVTDSNTLTFWDPEPIDRDASVTVAFVEPTDVEHVLVHPGKQEDGGKVVRPDPRPRELLFRVLDESGTVTEVEASIADEDGFQTVQLGVDDAVSVETVVVNCYPDPEITVCPITELEFQSKD